MTPEEVFDEDKAQEYEHMRQALWHEELVRAHTSMCIIEHVARFPARLLLDPTRGTFLPLVFGNFVDHVVLVVTKVFEEGGRGVPLTLPRLRNWIQENCRPEVQAEVRRALKGLRKKAEVKRLLEKARTLRHKRIAHRDVDWVRNPAAQTAVRVSLEDLRALLAEAEQWIRALSVGGDVAMVPLSYSDLVQYPTGLDLRSDIEYFLDLLAADSALLKMPEEQPEQWTHHKRTLTEAGRTLFNEWRERVGWEPVEFD